MPTATLPGPQRLLRWLTITPAAHYRLLDTSLQMNLYRLFHGRALSRVAHAVCTPIVTFFMLASLEHARIGGLPLSWLLALCIATYGFAYGMAVGLALTPVVGLLTAGAVLGRGLPVQATIGAMVLFAALQAWSHALEPVPPPLSGQPSFVPVRRWWRGASVTRRVVVLALSSSVFVVLELVASPKVLACQILDYLFAFGYRPAQRERTDREACALMADWRG